jgi:hypothetical protein
MTDLSDEQRAALSVAQAILQDTSSPVVVRHVASDQEITDTRFLLVLFETRGFLFDRVKGSTQIIDLAVSPSREDRQAAIIENAKAAAQRAGLGVVYFIGR